MQGGPNAYGPPPRKRLGKPLGGFNVTRRFMSVTHPQLDRRISTLLEVISEDAFGEWYQQRQIKQHMRDGNPWKHTPASVTPPRRHSPSRLLQCQRKTYYTGHNAPKEDPNPDGIFWAGSRIEEDLVMPYLEAVADDVEQTTYVQNSMWVDYELETAAGPLHIKGATDPVLCTRDGDPLLPTEIKTKESLEHFDSTDPTPSIHHRAQLHAYLHGLEEATSHSVQTGLIIYVSRKQHELLPIRVDFDTEFWRDMVIEWAANQTEHRLEEALPPAEPEHSWECKYCSFRERCGKGESPHEDVPAEGFVPRVIYPQRQVKQALRAEGGATALTPTLAHEYPALATEYDVADWRCPSCTDTYAWGEIEWDGRKESPPSCPRCADNGQYVALATVREDGGDSK